LHQRLTDEQHQRLRKLKELQDRGGTPYRYDRTHSAREISEQCATLSEAETEVRAAGRIFSLRCHGRTSFAHIGDETGKIQIYLREDELGEKIYRDLLDILDIGDFLGVAGSVFTTKTGEVTIRVREVVPLVKSLHPLPEKWHGLRDTETRYRHRYLDLMMNEDVRARFVERSRIIRYIRRFLDERGYLEVETPILQPQYGGAFAQPFVTHHKALDTTLYLRIADELYLKRLLVGGYEKVYEISKDFRNEGIDRYHNPEFTMLELYQAYVDYTDMMDLVEELVEGLVVVLHGSPQVSYQNTTIDYRRPWKRVSFCEVVEEVCGQPVCGAPGDYLLEYCRNAGLEVTGQEHVAQLVDKIYSERVQTGIIQPTFVLDYPKELSPLAKQHRLHHDLVERFEVVVSSIEIANAFSELNDPLEQRRRLEDQNRMRERGMVEAENIDEDFLMALEYGMPPAGGLGIGIDRLVMLLTDAPSIRDVVIFPQLRPLERTTAETSV
jgi:lysyl-tRNA synthetase class 2